MDILQTPSPNFNSRDGQAVDMLVLHYTGMKSGASANAMLDTLPAKERVKVLRIMSNSSIWNPAVGVAARQSMVNALAPDEQSQNRLAPQ